MPPYRTIPSNEEPNKLTETIQLELEKYRQKAAARLSTIMDQATDEAEANGFTPDILASILEQIES
ncbi:MULTISPECIES: hypothetical protein [unclassified Microcystis]|uniref:hypothetical protein n=1 Tax=unclassified Microcystis TaxID=2643300 RepID=UPI0025861ABC|nr:MULTISPECIES: hypothetical protein [unclassified Microcystis]MCA2763527.1 hypothetical protein [Microcystis sp. M151S2]MCA2643824.1 hypothetical protein [Microcystis sp. M087S2]MCA2672362.1 hypothetical protein [Microcystis sp. M080S2]MCA2689516.1 hypothetical protein [Microcystis sp. M037S2]MCA2733714.1 hypothetical protein [Microcystis sp. M158S2]